MYNYLEIMMTISSIFLIRTDSPEADEKKKALWAYLKKQNPRLYRRMRIGSSWNQPEPPRQNREEDCLGRISDLADDLRF